MAVEIRIDPIDFEPDIAVGIDLPMIAPKGTLFKQNYTTLDQAYANAKNLLLTNTGERIMQPNFGCNLRSFLFENMTEDSIAILEDNIRSGFQLWLPYVGISTLDIMPSEETKSLFVSLKIYLKGNDLDKRSINFEITNTQ